MKFVILLAAIVAPGLADAQASSSTQPTMNMPNYSNNGRDLEGYPFGRTSDTPTMRRERAMRALAFRNEAAALLRADGGTFTAEHQAYVQRKAREILSSGR